MMLNISKKKVKTVYALMYIAFVVGLFMFIAFEAADSKLLLLPGAAGICGAIYCNWWIRNQFKCPNCSNSLLRSRTGSRNRLVHDPLNTYDKYCSACGEEIKIRFTD